MAYKDRVKEDLDRWISAGLVGADKREAILASLPDARRLDAATALAWVGGILFGIAVITFVGANWDAIPRLPRFVLLLAIFLGFAGAGAWASGKRPVLSNILLLITALIFASAIGLTGQIFDIVGNPRTASYGAGLAAFALALAGRSTGAAAVGLVMIGLGDFVEHDWFSGGDTDIPWILFAAPLGVFLALRWSSAPLAHLAGLAILYCFLWFAARTHADAAVFLFLSILLGGFAAAARWLYVQDRPYAGVFYGWFAWGALMLFAFAGYAPLFGGHESLIGGIAHRLVWLGASGALLALARYDRHIAVSAIAILSLIGAAFALMTDLGLNLIVAAGVFMLCAIAAMAAGLILRGRAKAT
ncbi:MAG TPA: DUF2157 domain-containing protein [Vitreimonas sp.]|nr:DUF2157 domain-containing protein [Vitreimonas sp.]